MTSPFDYPPRPHLRKHGPRIYALSAITNANPIAPEDAGNIRKMAQAWRDWGKQQGYHR